jgi:hypothetical protein
MKKIAEFDPAQEIQFDKYEFDHSGYPWTIRINEFFIFHYEIRSHNGNGVFSWSLPLGTYELLDEYRKYHDGRTGVMRTLIPILKEVLAEILVENSEYDIVQVVGTGIKGKLYQSWTDVRVPGYLPKVVEHGIEYHRI